MSLQYRAPPNVIDLAVAQLKERGYVHPEATFNATAEDGRRREIAYRDMDLMGRLDRSEHETAIVDGALTFLKRYGHVDPAADYDRQAYEDFAKIVASTFTNPFHPGSGTTVGRVMQRLLYMLTSIRRPSQLIELGSFWGNTLAWFAGPCLGERPLYQPHRIVGIDLNVKMTDIARANFAKLSHGDKVELIAEDAHVALNRIPGSFDAVYLEAKSNGPDGHLVFYLPLLQQLYDRLPSGAWVLAHDVRHPSLVSQMAGYLDFVRNKANFSESICFDVDWCGLELSIK
jgi:predicted O-methyltransferase YrrM